ncbi:MAG: hypothetical protein V1660_03005 [archaeon]
MTIVKFSFDKEKDSRNIWDACNLNSPWSDFTKGINPRIVEMCKSNKYEDVKEKIIQNNSLVYNSPIIQEIISSFNSAWAVVEKEYFRRLERIMKTLFCCNKIDVFLTSITKCPYNPDISDANFMVNLFGGIPNMLVTSGHELMHIQFHNTYWESIEKKIGKEKTADLKEALTVLLNIEFKDLLLGYDQGYEKHKELRQFIAKSWNEDEDFDILIEKCIKFLQ